MGLANMSVAQTFTIGLSCSEKQEEEILNKRPLSRVFRLNALNVADSLQRQAETFAAAGAKCVLGPPWPRSLPW